MESRNLDYFGYIFGIWFVYCRRLISLEGYCDQCAALRTREAHPCRCVHDGEGRRSVGHLARPLGPCATAESGELQAIPADPVGPLTHD